MKKLTGALLAAAGVCAGAAYWLDLMNFTDLDRGFPLVGSVWVRYGVLGALLLVSALGTPLAARRPAALERRSLPLCGITLLCALVYAALGGVQLACCWSGAGEGGLLLLLEGVLALGTALFLLMQAFFWADGQPGRCLTGGVVLGILGTLYFLLLTFARFATNSSSFYRFAQTTQTFTALLALLVTSVLIRICCFPESRWGRRLYLAGIWAFYLCTCCEVPQAAARWMAGQTRAADLAVSLSLGCIGLLGAVCALSTLSEETETESE